MLLFFFVIFFLAISLKTFKAFSVMAKVRPTPGNFLCGVCCDPTDQSADSGSGRKTSQSQKVQALGCSLCQLWYHASCVKLTPSEFKFLDTAQNANIHWFCNACEVLSKPLLTRLTKVENRLESVEQRLSEAESKGECCANIVSGLDQKVSEINVTVDKISQSTSADVAKTAREVSDRLHRANNILVYGIGEEVTDLEQKITEILRVCDKQFTLKESPVRLGKVVSQKPRPVLVKLDNEKMKWSIIKTSKALKSSEFSSVFVSPDETQLQRQMSYALRKELRERRAGGEQDIGIKGGEIQQIKK